jgi:Predicted exporter
MSSIRCPQCNLINFATAVACKRCGHFFQAVGEFTQNSRQFAASDEAQNPYAGTHTNFNASPQKVFQPSQYQNYSGRKQKIGLALASMIIGIVGCFLTAPVGLILGIVALVKARRYPNLYGGKGFAIAGVALNAFGLLIVPLVLAIAVPNIMASYRASNEAVAVATIHRLAAAEDKFRATMFRCGDIKSLIATRLIDVDLASEEKNGYRFTIANLPENGCEIHAMPISASYGDRSFFYSTEDGVLRAAKNNGKPASKNDPPVSSQERTESSRK